MRAEEVGCAEEGLHLFKLSGKWNVLYGGLALVGQGEVSRVADISEEVGIREAYEAFLELEDEISFNASFKDSFEFVISIIVGVSEYEKIIEDDDHPVQEFLEYLDDRTLEYLRGRGNAFGQKDGFKLSERGHN
jgi:hypothetical protein